MRRSSVRAIVPLVITGIVGLCFVAPLAISEEWKAPERAERRKNPVPADQKSIAEGKALYTRECLACHGASGKGDGPAAQDLERSPGDLTSAAVRQQSDGALFWKITEGRKPMPSFESKLSEEQRWAVVNYMRTLAPPKGGGK